MKSWYWRKLLSLVQAFAGASRKQRRRPAKLSRPPYTRLSIEGLEDRFAPAVTASLSSGVLQIALGAASDQAVISPSGSSILVNGTGLSSQAFANVNTIMVQGANTLSQDVPNQSVLFSGSGGAIALDSAAGTDALLVTGVTSVSFTDLSINASSGNIDVEAAETTALTAVLADSAPQASVSVSGATLKADNITLSATASSTYANGTLGALNALGAATAISDLEPSATVSVQGPATTIAVNGAGGNVTIAANANVTVNSSTSVGTALGGSALNPTDAAIAESVVNSSAIAHVSGGAIVNAGNGAGILSITSNNTTNVDTEVDGSGAIGGATAAITLDSSNSQAHIDGGSTATGGTVNVQATTTNTATTSAKSTATGAGPNSAVQNVLAGKVDPAYLASVTPSSPNPGDKTSPAETAFSVGLPIAVAGAVAVTKFTPTTQAYVDSSTVTGTSAINIDASANNNTSTAADGEATTANANLSVGVAVAINDTDVNNTATVENTAGSAHPTTLTAPTITVQAGTPPVLIPDGGGLTPDLSSSASAICGVSGTNVGVAGALALNIVSNTNEASVPSGSTVAMIGNVTFNAQDTAAESASAQPPIQAAGGAGGTVGIGASVALNIASNTTLVELQDTAQLTGAHNLTFTAGSNDTVDTYSAAGATATGAVSLNPSAAISVVTNTTVAQVGAPDAANDTLVVGGAFSATATHSALTSTAAGANSGGGTTLSAGVSLALAFVTDQTTTTTGRSLDAQVGGVTLEADGSAASLVSAMASASGGPTKTQESQEPDSGPADGSKAGPGSDTADPNSVDGQNAEERSYADSESGTLTDSQGNPVSVHDTGSTDTPAAKTSDGSVTVAAAVALNIVNSSADATIPAGLTITAAGPLTVSATNDTGNPANPIYNTTDTGANANPDSPVIIGDTANAWGSATGTASVGIGAAVALNLVNTSAEATIQSSSSQPTTINTDGVIVNTGMLGATSTYTPMNTFGANSTSGAGAGDIGVAGSVAINIVTNTSQALIEPGASVNAHGGDVSLTSLNNSTDITFAVPGSPATGDDLGIGASVALNIITDTTQSEVQDGAALTNAGAVTVTATSSHVINTWAQNGAAGAVALGGGIAIAIANAPTTAYIGSAPQTLNASGAVAIGASGLFALNSVAAAATNPTGAVGIGASVVVNVAQDSFQAELDRNVTAGGAVSITANPVTSSSQAAAIASEQGASPSATSSSSGSNGTADQESQNQADYAADENGSTPTSLPNSNSEMSSPSSSASSKSGGSTGATEVGIAAAVAVNVLTTSTVAQIDNGLTVSAGGSLTVGTTNQSSALALADGRANKNGASIGAAVSLNVANVTNNAEIGSGDTISAAGVSVTALMATDSSGAVTPNDFSTQGLGVAIGAQAGIAGSVGINVITINTQASIGASTVVTSFAGLTVQTANDETLQNIAYTLAVGGDAGAGAAVNVNVLNNSTNAFLDSNVKANVVDLTQITSESSLNPSQDPVPNSPADAIVATGNSLSPKRILGVTVPDTYDVNGINATVISTATPAPKAGDTVDGPGIPVGTVIAEVPSHPFTGVLAFGSNEVASDDSVFIGDLQGVADPTGPQVGDTLTGPGIVPGTTITGISESPSGGATITLSLPAIGSGAAPLIAGGLVLFNPVSPLPTTGSVTLYATPDDLVAQTLSSVHPTNFAAGVGASSGGVGIAGSFIVNVINQTTEAFVNVGATINTKIGTAGYPSANADEGVTIAANETMNVVDWAGAIGGGDDLGLGAALDVNIVTETDEAVIAPLAMVYSAQNVAVQASTNGSFHSITAATGVGGSAVIAGAASIEVLTPTTQASVDAGTTVDAGGNVLVQADRQATISTDAGQVGAGGDASIGAAVSTIVDSPITEAFIAANDTIVSFGGSGTSTVLTGDSPGDTTTFSGVAVVGATFQNVQAIVVGGAVAGDLGLAGSVAVNVLNDTTLAYVGAGTIVFAAGGSPGNGPGVMVTAADPLTLFSTAGALAAGGDAGLGVGVDVDTITKNTQAYIATASVTAAGNVLVQAKSSKNMTSITAMVAASGTAAIDGSASVYVLNITTRAFIGDDPNNPTSGATNVQADGSLVVAAAESTLLDLLSGNLSGSGTLSIGVAASVPVVSKTTEAFIGAGANVGALGLGNAVNAETGGFTISYQPYGTAPGVAQPPAESLDLTGSANSLTSPRLGEERIATPETEAINGLAVTAVNADSLQGVGVTGGFAGTAAANLSGSVAVLTNHTDAYIGSGAAINSNNAGAAPGQSVLVAAGNDMSFLGIAGSLALAGDFAAAPGVVVLVVHNTTTASIDDGASVAANGNVAATAHASGDVLTIAAAAAGSGEVSLGGAISFVGIFDTTQANIGDSATSYAAGAQVNAGGNVLVNATDDTVAYLVTGALGVGVGAAGLGGAVSIVDLDKTTDAFLGNYATVNALGNGSSLSGIFDGDMASGDFDTLASFRGVAVQADTSENVTNVAAAGAFGAYAGLAGAVSIELFNSTTQADIGASAHINTSSAGANSAESVNVAAVNQAADNLSFGGAVAGGIAGLAGGIDIGLMQNSTQAWIGADAQVQAKQDVDVYALSDDSVDTFAVGAAVGAVAAVGSVSIWSIGVAYSAAYEDDEDDSAQAAPSSGITNTSGSAESQTGVASSMIGSLTSADNNGAAGNTQYISPTVSSDRSGVNGSITSDPVAGAIGSTAIPGGTVAYLGAGASVTAGRNVHVVAKSAVSYTGKVGGLAVGAAVGIGAAVELANIDGNTEAYLGTNATVSAGGNVTVDAELVSDSANGEVFAGTAGILGALGVQVVIIQDSSTDSAVVNSGAAIPQASQVQVTAASDDRSLDAQAIGGSAGLVGVGAAIAHADAGGVTGAELGGQIGQVSGESVGPVTVSATANDSAAAQSDEVAAGVVAGSGAESDATVDPLVLAFISDGSAITSSGAVTVAAIETPNASATALGIDVAAGVSIGVITPSATVEGTTAASLGNGVVIAAPTLVIDAERNSTAQSSATAGVGALLAGSDATDSTATSDGYVQATTGAGVFLPDGDVTIEATSTSDQSANATGVVVGILAIGVDEANANSNVTTTAELGAGAITDMGRTGDLDVLATGTDTNDVSTTAGSGGLIAGDASVGNTTDNSTVAASLGGAVGTTIPVIYAGTVTVSAVNHSVFTPDVDSVNAALAGASGAAANNTDTTAANATVNSGTAIMANFAVDVTAQNTFTETLPTGGNTVSAGAGGFLNGTAATSTTTLTGNATVTIGSDVSLNVEAPGTTTTGNPGIYLIASSALTTDDNVTLSAGGAIEGAGTTSSLTANLTNQVITDSTATAPDNFTTNQNIGIGTYTTVNALTTSMAHTFGAAGALAIANATTDVTADQTVTLGPDTNLSALYDINLIAGDNPLPGQPEAAPWLGVSNAQSFARGFIGIPTASANTDLISNATLTVGSGDQINGGENITLSADPGSPAPTATGIAHGYELYFIPATSGSSTPSSSTSSTVTVNGTVTAGAYHELDITIPLAGTTVNSNSGGAAFTYNFQDFNPQTTIADTPSSAFPAGAPSAYNGMVAAVVLGPLFAAGGDVTVNAGSLTGAGTLTANGGPAINVTNYSPDYLVLGSITIPDEPGGQVFFTGLTTAPPSSLHVNQDSSPPRPVVNIQELYNQPVAPSSDGPGVFLTADDTGGGVTLNPDGAVNNLAGQVAITVAYGSLVEVGALNALQVNISVVNGTYAIANPFGLTSTGIAPSDGWDSAMFWPGGTDPITTPLTTPAERTALATVYADFVANVMYNSSGAYGTGFTTGSQNGSEWQYNNFTAALLGFSGQTAPDNSEVGFPSSLSQKLAATSLVFVGADAPWSDDAPPSQDSDSTASSASFGGAGAAFPPYAYHISNSADDGDNNDANEGIFPVIPVYAVPATTNLTYAQQTGSSSTIDAGAVYIDAKYIDIDGHVNVGQPNAKSVNLPATLNSTIALDQSDYSLGIPSSNPLDAPGYYTLSAGTVNSGDAPIGVQFDAITNQIVVNNVSAAGGGFIALDGIIMNTNTLGEINVYSDLGQVTIDNETNFPLVIKNTSASKTSTTPTLSGVDIIDQAYATPLQTLRVYQPNNTIAVYLGSASESVQQLEQGTPFETISGNQTDYDPDSGMRWEWQLQTTIQQPNLVPGNISTAGWSFDTSGVNDPDGTLADQPWYYLTTQDGNIADGTTTPTGWLVSGSETPDFQETISGTVTDSVQTTISYHNNDYGFAPAQNPTSDGTGQIDPWTYIYATQAELTLTESVKADNQIGIEFSGPTQSSITINSNTPVIVEGNLQNPLGTTSITALSVTQTAAGSITSDNVTVDSALVGGVGTAQMPLDVSMTGTLNVQAGSGGAYLNLGSGAVLGTVTASNGDVVVNATGSLTAGSGASVSGNDITLHSSEGTVGTAANPLLLSTSGVVNVTALGDIGLKALGSLQVGAICSTAGDVSVSVPLGSILNADSPAVLAFQNEVNAAYSAYWQLIDNGTVQSGTFSLNADAVQLYTPAAADALGVTDPTIAQVQSYANTQYQNDATFFNAIFDSGWLGLPQFQTDDPAFSYTATGAQIAGLGANSAYWTLLKDPLAQVALNPAAGIPVETFTDNLCGNNITLVAGNTSIPSIGYIGQAGTPLNIPLAAIQSGSLTPAEIVAITDAVTTGDIVYTYTSGQVTGVQVTPTVQVFVMAAGVLTANATGSITIQSTAQAITLGQIAAGGPVNITAPASILSSGSGTQITTPDATVLKVETGSVGTPTTYLTVNVGGLLNVYTPPGQAYINGTYAENIPTDLVISPSATNPVNYGQSVTLTATITATSGSGVPTGSVEFYDGSTDLGPGTTLQGSGTSATSTFTISNLAVGSYPSLTAVYTSTGDFETSWNSLSVAVQPAPLTITAVNESKTYGATFTPSGTTQFTVVGLLPGDSISGVMLTSSGYAATASVVAPGPNYPIVPSRATGSDLSNYAITYVNGTFTVDPATLTITAASESKTYGTTFTPNGTAQFTTNGLVNGDSVSSVTLASSGYATSATVAGPGPHYAITPSAAVGIGLGNYTLSYMPGTLAVTPASLTITANNLGKTYGINATLAPTAFSETGLITANGDAIVGVTETSSGAPASATVIAPGPTYAIVPSAATGTGLANYTISYVDGTLTVFAAPLTITAANESKPYGTTFTPNGTTQFNFNGLANNDSVTSVMLSSSGYASTATVVTPGPNYPITVSTALGSGLGNYTIYYMPGTLTVTPATLTITATNESKTYGATFTPVGTMQFTTNGLTDGDSVSSVTLASAGYASTATVVGPGPNYPIAPSMAEGSGLANYTISYVNGTCTVNAAPLTITANSATKPYGQTATFAATAFTEAGLVTANGDSIAGVTETSSGAAASATITAPGPNYPIVPTGATGTDLGNYAISYVNGTLTIEAGILTITAADESKTYGTTFTPDGTTQFTVTGLASGDSVASAVLTSAGYAASATVVGPGPDYAITPSGAVGVGLSNYTIDYVNGTMTVNAAPLTITANNATKTYGQTATFSATAFSETGLVTTNGDAIIGVTETSTGASASATVTAPGPNYPIVPAAATGTGLGNYAVRYANGALTINPATLTITAANESKTYGTTFTPAGSTQFSTSGLTNGDDVVSVTLTSTGYAASATVVGPGPNYAITPSGAQGSSLGNYTINYVNGAITVNAAPLTITADNATKTYGQTATFAATAFTASGLVTANGDAISGVTETSTGAPTSATVAAPGPNYPIVASGATGTGLGNYAISYANGTLTIDAAPLTITAANESKIYGTTFTPNGTTQFTTSGQVNGDSVTSVTLASNGYASTATVAAPGPNYSITPSGAVGSGLSNYAVTYVNGVMTVNPAPLPVTVNNQMMLAGNSPPPLTGTANGVAFTGSVTLRTTQGDTVTVTLSTLAGPSSPAGLYAIAANVSGAAAANYLTPTPGTMQVVTIGKETTAPANAVFYYRGGDASNPYAWLTAQLTNVKQNINAGYIQTTDLVYAGSLVPFNAAGVRSGGFTAINNLMALANQAIVQYANPVNRTTAFMNYLTAIAQALQAANDDSSFVQ